MVVGSLRGKGEAATLRQRLLRCRSWNPIGQHPKENAKNKATTHLAPSILQKHLLYAKDILYRKVEPLRTANVKPTMASDFCRRFGKFSSFFLLTAWL